MLSKALSMEKPFQRLLGLILNKIGLISIKESRQIILEK